MSETEDPRSSVTGVVVDAAPLADLGTTLFVQADTDQFAQVAPLLDACGVGVVYTQSSKTRHRSHPGGSADYTKQRSRSRDILLDAGRYSGSKRRLASSGIDESWIRFQLRELGLPWAMTDSGYCGRGDLAGVAAILRAADKLRGRIIVTLPVARYLLIESADAVRDLIEKQDHPVTVILEHPDDPCGQIGVVPGLLHLLAGGPPVGLLRADASALGVLANGGVLGAVGTRPGLRHFYPLQDGGGIGPASMVVPELLTYKYLEKIFEAHAVDPTLPQWRCSCHVCAGRGDVGWIPPRSDREQLALEHSVSALAQVARDLGQHSNPASAWVDRCHAAQLAHFGIGEKDKHWDPKAFLRRWVDLTPTPAKL